MKLPALKGGLPGRYFLLDCAPCPAPKMGACGALAGQLQEAWSRHVRFAKMEGQVWGYRELAPHLLKREAIQRTRPCLFGDRTIRIQS